VKHLLFEHQNEITTAKTDAEIELKLVQDENRSREAELKTDKRGLKLESKEMQLSNEDYLKSLKQLQDRNIALLRQEFERKSSELHKNFEKKMKTVRDAATKRHKSETQAIEERKNSHIKQLMKAHEAEFADIKVRRHPNRAQVWERALGGACEGLYGRSGDRAKRGGEGGFGGLPLTRTSLARFSRGAKEDVARASVAGRPLLLVLTAKARERTSERAKRTLRG
jgi:hypothetical protein